MLPNIFRVMEAWQASKDAKNPEELKFSLGKMPVFNFATGFVMPKGAPWQHEVNEVILRLKEGGIIQHIINSYMPLNVDLYLNPPGDTNPKAFQIAHFAGLLVLFAALQLLSLVAFALELLFMRRVET